MLLQHLILNIPADASDEEIRSRYLKLVKKYPPEKNPERFREITEAYESISTRRQRIEEQLFGNKMNGEYDDIFRMIARSRDVKRRRAGLRELLKAGGDV